MIFVLKEWEEVPSSEMEKAMSGVQFLEGRPEM